MAEIGDLCSDGIDNDCDGNIDGADLDCGAVYPLPLDMTEWGASCSWGDTACGADLSCLSLGSTGGGACGLSCYEVCPNGFSCVSFGAGGYADYCLTICASNANCPDGYVCAKGGPTDDQVCTQPCVSNNDCLQGVECNRASNLCGMGSRVEDLSDGGPTADGAPGDPEPGDPVPAPADAGRKDDGCGCRTANDQGGSVLTLGLVAVFCFTRRRRR